MEIDGHKRIVVWKVSFVVAKDERRIDGRAGDLSCFRFGWRHVIKNREEEETTKTKKQKEKRLTGRLIGNSAGWMARMADNNPIHPLFLGRYHVTPLWRNKKKAQKSCIRIHPSALLARLCFACMRTSLPCIQGEKSSFLRRNRISKSIGVAGQLCQIHLAFIIINSFEKGAGT